MDGFLVDAGALLGDQALIRLAIMMIVEEDILGKVIMVRMFRKLELQQID